MLINAQAPFAAAYANVLCNLALAQLLLGDAPRRDECLSSAFKALEQHSDHALVHPTLGRVLVLAAVAHLSAAQAVTAEGLLRSALDRLSSSCAAHDIR